MTPSLSASSSQASPVPSPSASSCPEFGTNRQLSWKQAQGCGLRPGGTSRITGAYLFAVLVLARELLVGIRVDVRVLPALVAVPRPADAALARQPKPQWLKRARERRRSPPPKPYRAADAAVPLHDALPIGVAGAGLPVGAEPGVLAAFDLVAREARFAVPAVERALVETPQGEGGGALCDPAPPLMLALPWCCSSASWRCRPRSQVGPNTRLRPCTPGTAGGAQVPVTRIKAEGFRRARVPVCASSRRAPPPPLTPARCIPEGISRSESLEQCSRT